jgi:hypothetical protein
MAQGKPNRDLQLRFGGTPTDAHAVPASVLTQALQSLQRAVHLLGMRHEGKEFRQRLRVSAEIEMRYTVLCQLPTPGSFVSPIVIGDISQRLFDSDAVDAVTRDLLGVLDAVNAQDAARVRSLLPDAVFRTSLLSSLAKMAAPKHSGIEIDLQSRDGQSLLVPAAVTEFVLQVVEQQQAPDSMATTVTGRLIGIDFADRMLRLHYPPTKRELKCSYHEAVESMLLDNPREYIQVFGHVILDKNGDPDRISDVERIMEVDLSPITVSAFLSGKLHILARRPVQFAVMLDETAQFHCIEDGDFGIDLVASTREELELDLLHELDVLWRQYALEKDDILTSAAKKLKNSLLDVFEVAP